MSSNRITFRSPNRYALLALPLLAGGCAGNNPGTLEEANAQRIHTSPIVYPDGTKLPCERLETAKSVACVDANARVRWTANNEGNGQQRVAKALWDAGGTVATGAGQGALLGFETRTTTSAEVQAGAAGAGVNNYAASGSCIAINAGDCAAVSVGRANTVTTQVGGNQFNP